MRYVNRYICVGVLGLLMSAAAVVGQVPVLTMADILKAEDARDYGSRLEGHLRSANEDVRLRAALAAGRIGDEAAIAILAEMLATDKSEKVKAMAAFAIGEIESVKGADAILNALAAKSTTPDVKARAVEAAGKIAAANAKDESHKRLGTAIINVLAHEHEKRSGPYDNVIRFGITAALRARPEGAEEVIRPFLGYSDPAMIADALNTLARLRAKLSNRPVRELLKTHADATVRANAARVLGAADDKDSVEILIAAATADKDSRVRVSAIRALAQLNDKEAGEPLLTYGNVLLTNFNKAKKPGVSPAEKSELLEIVTALGRLFADNGEGEALEFVEAFRVADGFISPESETAFARIAPAKYVDEFSKLNNGYKNFRIASAYASGFAQVATVKDEELKLKAARTFTAYVAAMSTGVTKRDEAAMSLALPDMARTLAALKPDNLDDILRSLLANDEVFLRAAVASLLGERPVTKENIDALKKAFAVSMIRDKKYNDATLAIMDALFKLDKNESVGVSLTALNAADHLVRNKAFELLAQADTEKFPGVPTFLEAAREKNGDKVLPYRSYTGTRLGQLLNTNVDYRRAASRKNGSVKAVFNTQKGTFTIDLLPEDAPLTVDNFVKLARAGYFNGLEVHRVVPNFVMQDGDPVGNGSGGPGWSIRCEVNMAAYDRGAVGMALSGKDTGGSQWFVTHSPQPHLDGGYTVFGKVNETDMNVVDKIVRGDKILTVRIVSGQIIKK